MEMKKGRVVSNLKQISETFSRQSRNNDERIEKKCFFFFRGKIIQKQRLMDRIFFFDVRFPGKGMTWVFYANSRPADESEKAKKKKRM